MLTQVTNAILSAEGGSSNILMTVLPFVVLIAVFYFLLIRPESRRKKAAEKRRNELSVGDQITTIGGIVGNVCAVKENTIVIETGADRVRIEFTKWAVSTKGTATDATQSR